MSMASSKKLIVISSVLLVLILVLPTTVLAIDIDGQDGLWTDTFDNSHTVRLISGTSRTIVENGEIHLVKSSQTGRNYTFAGGGTDAHRAYYYYTPFTLDGFFGIFYSPTLHTSKEYQFDTDFMYPNIETKGGPAATRYAESTSTGYKKNVVQHFKMKLDGTPQSIGNLYIYWYGKAENAQRIELYYWKYNALIPILSKWVSVNKTSKTGDTVLFYNLSQSALANATDANNNINFCVVAYASSTPCSLYTDYVVLQSKLQQGYKVGYAYAQTAAAISLPAYGYWDLLTWDDFESGSATVKYQLLYADGTLIDDSVLEGNEEGFTDPPVSLTPLDSISSLFIRANLSTNDPLITPRLFSLTITWQAGNKWQDLFHSSYRIDDKDKVTVNRGVNISLVSGDWPMFGQNPSNTRASSGVAALTKDLYWWSDYHELLNQTVTSMIIDGETLYLATNSTVYQYPTIIIPANQTGEDYLAIYPGTIKDFSYLTAQHQTIVGSPAVSENYLVVATGDTGDTDTANYVYGFDKALPSDQKPWEFDYSGINPNNPDISYWGSPTIAEDLVFLTSWSGDTSMGGYQSNNMLLALYLNNGTKKWAFTFPEPPKPALSPTWSFSTPAYSDGAVVVGCMNDQNDSLFAFNAQTGDLLWNITVGAIGKAAPVINNGVVYVVSEEKALGGTFSHTVLTAVSLDDGSVRWSTSLGKMLFSVSLDPTVNIAEVTPAIADNVLYVTSPDGYISAYDLVNNGTSLWSRKLYNKTVLGPVLTSSPAYADGVVYFGTPDGVLFALDASADGATLWYRQTFPPEQKLPVVTNPIVSNGLVFFADQNGRLYVCGNYVKPNQAVSGSIVSEPIYLPVEYWWNRFYAATQTNQSASINKITFSLLDVNKQVIQTPLTNRSVLSAPNGTLPRVIRLRADFWAKNSSVNPKLLSWNVTFVRDYQPPFINISTLSPNPHGWLNIIIPSFTVNVKDNGTGLLVSSAQYTLAYVLDDTTYVVTAPAVCTGVNGTTAVQQLTVDLTKLDFFDNITSLKSLTISIRDLAGNIASKTISFEQDTIKPTSSINAPQSFKKIYNATTPFIWVNATAWDNGTDASGVAQVQLYYRYSTTGVFTGDWLYYTNSTNRLASWKFEPQDDPSQNGGYFELTTIAIDKADNVEDFPDQGDVIFLYDWTIPDLPSVSGQTLWFNALPQISSTFTDDFRLDTVQYRPNFDTTWTTIASDINQSTYHATWQLKQSDWDQMLNDQTYYLYFRINDTVGNVRMVTLNSQALIIKKDVDKPIVTIEVPGTQNEWSSSGNFTINAFANDRNGSGVTEVALYYNYSKDNHNWTGWIHFDSNLTNAPYNWSFNSPEGDGYYKFQIRATDAAGNEAESTVFSSGVARLPSDLIMVMVVLVIALLLLSGFLYLRWRKKK